MEHKIKLMIFIKISTFIFLSLIYHLCTYMSTHNRSLVKFYNHDKKLFTRNYRLLEKYKKNMDAGIICLKEEIQSGVNDKNDISYYEKCILEKKKQSNENLPRNARRYKKNVKNKSCILVTKKCSYLEKKIFKELDYVDFLKNNRTISDKFYKKIIFKKRKLRFFLPLSLLLLLSVSIILDYSCSLGLAKGLIRIVSACYGGKKWVSTLGDWLKKTSPFNEIFKVIKSNGKDANLYVTSLFRTSIYCICFLMLGIAIILGVVYYHKKVKKYEKIKFRKR
ncbi:fam-l protein [Plasmodium malariae]|uniref:Fam-l protein n=1 Tax=Plasmodium malariae TaxID=5858 RepID=A0A1D3JH57_PLAMA|nr:fam-l protein [Plasmodium malariae]SBT85645.1 fam-l protein [Plasmodium malariae]